MVEVVMLMHGIASAVGDERGQIYCIMFYPLYKIQFEELDFTSTIHFSLFTLTSNKKVTP